MTRTYSIRLASVVLLAAAASACDTVERWTGTEQSGSVETTSMPSGTVTTTRIPTEFQPMRAEQLIGKSVYNGAGERVGEIDQIAVNRQSRATAAVVGVGGFMGVGEKKVVVPLDNMRLQGDRIVAPELTRERVNALTAYDDDSWYRYDRTRTLGELVR